MAYVCHPSYLGSISRKIVFQEHIGLEFKSQDYQEKKEKYPSVT
jgi:hypothetical protein